MHHKAQVTQSPSPPRLTNPNRGLAKRTCVTEAPLPQGKELQIGAGFLLWVNTLEAFKLLPPSRKPIFNVNCHRLHPKRESSDWRQESAEDLRLTVTSNFSQF